MSALFTLENLSHRFSPVWDGLWVLVFLFVMI